MFARPWNKKKGEGESILHEGVADDDASDDEDDDDDEEEEEVLERCEKTVGSRGSMKAQLCTIVARADNCDAGW